MNMAIAMPCMTILVNFFSNDMLMGADNASLLEWPITNAGPTVADHLSDYEKGRGKLNWPLSARSICLSAQLRRCVIFSSHICDTLF